MDPLSTRLQNLQNTINIYKYVVDSIEEEIKAYQMRLAKKIPVYLEPHLQKWFPVPMKPKILKNKVNDDIYDEFISRNDGKFSTNEEAIFIKASKIDPYRISQLCKVNKFSYRFNYLYACLLAKFWTNEEFNDKYWEELYHLFCYEYSVKDRLVLIPSLGLTGNNVLSPFIEGISSYKLSSINDKTIKTFMYIGQKKEKMIIAPETSYKLFLCVFGEKTLKSLVATYYTDKVPKNVDYYNCIPIVSQLNELWMNQTNLMILRDKLTSILNDKKIYHPICINSLVISKNIGSTINATITQECKTGVDLAKLPTETKKEIEKELAPN